MGLGWEGEDWTEKEKFDRFLGVVWLGRLTGCQQPVLVGVKMILENRDAKFYDGGQRRG